MSNKTEQLKKSMTDSMWKKVEIKYGDETYLQLEDQTKITEISKIISHLQDRSPSLVRKMNTARKAATKAYQHATKTGEVKAPPSLIATRRKTCQSCPFNKKRLFGNICTACGCNIKLKTALLTESCPELKW